MDASDNDQVVPLVADSPAIFGLLERGGEVISAAPEAQKLARPEEEPLRWSQWPSKWLLPCHSGLYV